MKRLEIEEIVKTLNSFKGFTGGPTKKFSEVALSTFYSLSVCGLNQDSKFLDIGCGALRLGFLIMNYLHKNNYYGVEPNQIMLEEGKKKLAQELLNYKNPTFSNDENFSFQSEFNDTKFDLALARSIFTHTSKEQIDLCLLELSKVMKKDGIFLLTYLPPKGFLEKEYNGNDWVGKSHKSNIPGLAKYKKTTLLNFSIKHGFVEDEENSKKLLTANQEWLVLRKI